MADYRVISSDSHGIEPADLWANRIGRKFKDRAPEIVTLEEGDWWFCDGRKVVGLGIGAQAGVRFEHPENLRQGASFEDVRPGGYIPEEHVKDMDADGVDAGVVYPSISFMMYNVVPESDLLSAIFHAYNGWVGEFCQSHPDRLKPIAMLNLDDLDLAIKDLQRYANLGFVGAMIPVLPPEGREYIMPEYEPLWAAAQDLGMPISFHVFTNRPGTGQEFTHLDSTTASFLCNRDYWVRMSLGHMIFNGVFEPYPKLQVGTIEFELGWVPHFLAQMDYTYTQRDRRPIWHRYKEDMLPSDYFHRNVFVGFQGDALGIRLRDLIGVDNLLWGSDYPHPEGTFPKSQDILDEILADCSEDEKAKIVGGNAARVYRFD